MHTLNKVIAYSKLVDVADTQVFLFIFKKSLSTSELKIKELNSTGWAKGVETSLTLDAEAHPHAASSHVAFWHTT